MSDSKDINKSETTASRRKTLKTALAGSAIAASLPTAWIKPTVSSVVLPGHAATSGDGGEPGAGTTAAPVCDPAVVNAVEEARLSYYQNEGGYIDMEFGGGITGTLTDISITNGTGALASSEVTNVNSEGGGTEGYANFEATQGQDFPQSVDLALTFDDQPAPCVVSANVRFIPSPGQE